jgi:hypothetical protein
LFAGVDVLGDFLFKLRHFGAFEDAADVKFRELGGGIVGEVG